MKHTLALLVGMNLLCLEPKLLGYLLHVGNLLTSEAARQDELQHIGVSLESTTQRTS